MIQSKIRDRFLKKKQTVLNYDDEFNFDELLERFDIPLDSHIFIHAGLKNIKQISKLEYKSIVESLIQSIQKIYKPSAIIAPAFTPSFRKCGVYSKLYSKGEYGVFSEIFRGIADYRTDDAIHSVSIISQDIEKFKNLNYDDSFSTDGFFGSFHKNTYIINISTEHFVSTYMHYVEELMKVPYKDKSKAVYKGVIYDENNIVSSKIQTNHYYKFSTMINRTKVKSLFLKNQYISYYRYKNIEVSCIKVEDLVRILTQSIEKNPYYLVTF
jgi:aminoglycoside N3'-acetyltransferase